MSQTGMAPERLVFEITPSGLEIHGMQEGRCYHGYYSHYGDLPLYIFTGPTSWWAAAFGKPISTAAQARRTRSNGSCPCPGLYGQRLRSSFERIPGSPVRRSSPGAGSTTSSTSLASRATSG